MLSFQLIVYDDHRQKICLFQDYASGKWELPYVYPGNFFDEDYKEVTIAELAEHYDLEVEIERPALLQFNYDDHTFYITFVVKETKHNPDQEWFDLNNLPVPIDEFSMRALRAEMQDVTYEICEYNRPE